MKARAFGSRNVGRADRMKRTGREGTTAEDMAASIRGGQSRRRRSPIMLLVVAACWLLMAGPCAGQKPINLGGSKKRDVYIAGFFPYGNHVPEGHIGRGVMPAVKLAVEHINEHPTILRDYRLHMWWNDTECSAAVGMKAFFDMMHNGPHKVILFGGACTQVTDPIAKASKHWRLTQLSYADTHPMFTTNSFPNFFRVVPSENALNAPRVALLLHFNWTRVGTIYQNEPRYSLVHNRLVADLDESKMELVATLSFATEVTSALEKLKEKDVRILLGNFNEAWARRIFCEAYRFGIYGRKYQWVIIGTYTREWWLRPGGGCAPSELSEALHGVILTDLLPLTTEEQYTTSGITPDQYQIEYDSRRGGEYSRFHGYTYDGIWTVALAVKHVARRIRHFHRNQTISDFRYRDVLWEKLFLDALRNTSFDGVTGPVRFYDNERKAYILLKQFQNGREVNVGEYDSITGVLDLTRGEALLWKGRAPPKDRTVRIIEHSTVDITLYAVLASVASVGIVMASIFLIINIRYRNQRYIKMSSPYLNNLIIVGCMLTYSSVIFLGLDSQLSSVTAFPYICTARAWLLMAGFSLAFGSMFSKTWRVHSIFTDVKLNKKVIKDYQLFMVVGILLTIDLSIMTTWQVADPFYREIKQMEPYHHPSSDDIIIVPENEYCQSNQMNIYLGCIYAYKGLLMIFGAFLAWETRHVSIPALNDSKYVGMSVYNVVIMCVTGAAISFVLTDKQDAMFIMLAVFIIFCSTTTLCLVFIPKVRFTRLNCVVSTSERISDLSWVVRRRARVRVGLLSLLQVIELRRNPQGVINKRTRATLRPMLKIRRDSTVSELDERLKEAKLANKKFRKQLLQKDSELQGFLRRMGEEVVSETQETVDTLPVPKQEEVAKKEETTDISMSMCSLNSSTVSQPEGDYVNVDQVAKKRASIAKTTSITIDNERMAMTAQAIEKATISPDMETVADAPPSPPPPPPTTTITTTMTTTMTMTTMTTMTTPTAAAAMMYMQHTCGAEQVPRRKSVPGEVSKNGEPLLLRNNRSPEPLPNDIARTRYDFVPPVVEESDSVILEETEIARHVCHVRRSRDERRAKLSTPPPTKNVSFGELHEQSYIEQVIMPFPLQYVSNHRHSEKYEESMSTIIQRSMSERSREKCLRLHIGGGHPIVECSHRVARRMCRHTGSKLRQQARLEYVQSTPNVATMHNSKHAVANPRGGTGDVNGGSAVNVSKMYSAVSDGELLDLTILPIFQKLLTERHKSTARRGYRSNIASCPNISIKCDIVEYL
ncbi:gamma-aminobutyric acid type B receptor subunit 2 isoform X2 [Odontomachus brunneus]|uniref:gamma-aminobutyric acid type B receptor subunit 2 isoform X2 n=1 Tax=Odontomachus brunneus TaxID=486640 RepID=UPI0013F20670|nr:gamma-aminobutyric acid type B receptor subunit 2 isoform X2 [Odontomachus brunneus]